MATTAKRPGALTVPDQSASKAEVSNCASSGGNAPAAFLCPEGAYHLDSSELGGEQGTKRSHLFGSRFICVQLDQR